MCVGSGDTNRCVRMYHPTRVVQLFNLRSATVADVRQISELKVFFGTESEKAHWKLLANLNLGRHLVAMSWKRPQSANNEKNDFW